MTGVQNFVAPGLRPCVAIRDGGRLAVTLDEVMVGWRLEAAPGTEAAAIRVVEDAGGWTCSGETYRKPVRFTDPVATACSLIASLHKAHTLVAPDGLCLHAAGIRIGAGLVLLTGRYGAGKTVVAAAAAAAGLQVFSDDIIPMSGDAATAFAPGLAIRLRLPLPGNLAEATRAFIDRHRIASSQRYAYIRPPADRLAPKGASAPVVAVAILNRSDDGPAGLRRLARAEALSETIRRNFAREAPAARILDALDGLIGRAVALRLDYARAEEAVDILRAAAGRGFADLPVAEDASPAPHAAEPSTGPVLAAATRIARSPGVESRERDGQAFLTDAESGVIFNLNLTGAAVWRLIGAPMRFGEMLELFAAGFPDRPRDALAGDLSVLLRQLARRGLVRLD